MTPPPSTAVAVIDLAATSADANTLIIDLDAEGEELAGTHTATGAVNATLLLLLLVVDVEALLLTARRNFTRVPSNSGRAGAA